MSSDALAVRFSRGLDVTYKPVAEGALLLDRLSGRCLELNALGAEIWSLLDGDRTLAQVCGRLKAVFDVSPQVLQADVQRFASDLEELNLVRRQS